MFLVQCVYRLLFLLSDENEEALLRAELAKIRKEREIKKRKEEEKRKAEEKQKSSNPLLAAKISIQKDSFTLKRR